METAHGLLAFHFDERRLARINGIPEAYLAYLREKRHAPRPALPRMQSRHEQRAGLKYGLAQ